QPELVAYGAAVQAGALALGVPLTEVARAWDARRGLLLPAVARDEAVLAAIGEWREHVIASARPAQR
ncbi:MAG TPA: hypothetical protein VME46_18260, partial [Acidimicrobiales bacterium]|nr:hypothetical protein [Acidimicrobiales bacterium]